MARGKLWLAHFTPSRLQTSFSKSQHLMKPAHVVFVIPYLKHTKCDKWYLQNKLNLSNMQTILSQISQLSQALNTVKPAYTIGTRIICLLLCVLPLLAGEDVNCYCYYCIHHFSSLFTVLGGNQRPSFHTI